MEKQAHRTRIGSRVRIKDSVTGAYPMARVYMEGEVKAQRHDDFGYPLIYVKWDQNHWAYSGERDGWTMEAHFDVIESRNMSDKDKSLMEALSALIAQYSATDMPEGEPDAAEEVTTLDLPDPSNDTYADRLKRAVEDAEDGEAFIMVVARKEELRGHEVVAPHFYAFSTNDDAMLLLEATLSDIGAQRHAQLAFEKIRENAKDDPDSQ